MQGFLELSICFVLSHLRPKNGLYSSGNFSDIFSELFSYISVIAFVMVFYFIWIPLIDKSILDKNAILNEVYDEVYSDINMNPRHKWKKYFHIFFLTRRLLFVLTLVFLNGYLYLQLSIHIIITLVYLSMFLGVKPYSDPNDNKWEVFNETCVMCVSYILIVLNDTSTSPEMRDVAGLFYVGICFFNLAINAGKMLRAVLYETIPD